MTALDVTQSLALEMPHAFLGRAGGVSTGIYASLNTGLGSADDPAHVRENHRRALGQLWQADSLVTLHQVHSARALTVAAPIADHQRPHADALATRTRGLALGVLTADCAPVLLADSHARVIGAAHAGWKGAFGGVIEAVVACMEELGADRAHITAAIGPCIAQASYEVADSFADALRTAHPEPVEAFFAPGRPGHHQFALEAYVASKCAAAGIATIDPLGLDTYAHPDRWFSYRRATHAQDADYGRQLSLITLR